MTKRQQIATERLRKALDACHKSGLKGGVYDGHFYFWPIAADPDPRDAPGFGFFDAVRECGGDFVISTMALDGGAGV